MFDYDRTARTPKDPNTSWTTPLGAKHGWGSCLWFGQWTRCWIQSEDHGDYWVQIDSDGPFRKVDRVRFD